MGHLTTTQCCNPIIDSEIGNMLRENEKLRSALQKISDGECDDPAGDPIKWSRTIAFLALGGEIKDGKRVYNRSQI